MHMYIRLACSGGPLGDLGPLYVQHAKMLLITRIDPVSNSPTNLPRHMSRFLGVGMGFGAWHLEGQLFGIVKGCERGGGLSCRVLQQLPKLYARLRGFECMPPLPGLPRGPSGFRA